MKDKIKAKSINDDIALKIHILEKEGYARKEIAYNNVRFSIQSLFIGIPFVVVLLGLYRLCGNMLDLAGFTLSEILILLIVILLFGMVHELIHGVIMALFSKDKFRAISFEQAEGIQMLCCKCRESLSVERLALVAIMPSIILCVLPAVIASTVGSDFILLVAIIMIFLGGSDLLCICKFMTYKAKNRECVCFTHPYQTGYVVMERNVEITG